MRTRFHFPAFIFSLVFGVLFVFNLEEALYDAHINFAGGIVIMAVFFGLTMAGGWLGLKLGLWTSRKQFTVPDIRTLRSGLLITLLGGALIGTIGQAIFFIGYVEHTEVVQLQGQQEGLHAVLLLDGSTSMRDKRDSCNEAACGLIESLTEKDSLEVIAFAKSVEPRNVSAFLSLTEANKDALQDMVRGADLAGGTDFNTPLNMALSALADNRDATHIDVILMLTDGEAPLREDVKDALSQADAPQLYTIRITPDTALTQNMQALVNLADKDFPIQPSPGGGVDVNSVLQAFSESLKISTTQTITTQVLGLREDLMIAQDRELYWWRIADCVLVFALAFLLEDWCFFGPSFKSLLLHGLLGAATGYLFTQEYSMSLFAYAIFGLGAFVKVREEPQDV